MIESPADDIMNVNVKEAKIYPIITNEDSISRLCMTLQEYIDLEQPVNVNFVYD